MSAGVPQGSIPCTLTTITERNYGRQSQDVKESRGSRVEFDYNYRTELRTKVARTLRKVVVVE